MATRPGTDPGDVPGVPATGRHRGKSREWVALPMVGTVTDRCHGVRICTLRPRLAPSRGRISMRIGLIAPPWIPVPPPAYGGTESVIDRLARGLVRAGHDVLLAAAANSSCPVGRVAGTDDAVDGAPASGAAVTELRHVITSYAAMADVDVVHDHTMCGPTYGHRPVGIPAVTTNHGPFDDVLNPSTGPRV